MVRCQHLAVFSLQSLALRKKCVDKKVTRVVSLQQEKNTEMEICVRRRLLLCAFNRMCVRIGVSNVDLLIQELQTLNHVHLSSPLAG